MTDLSDSLRVRAKTVTNRVPKEDRLLHREAADELEASQARVALLEAVVEATKADPGAQSDAVYYALVALEDGPPPERPRPCHCRELCVPRPDPARRKNK